MRRWAKFECCTIQGNGLLEVSHGLGTLIEIIEGDGEVVE
jgi:hypothetical protein